MVFNALKQHSVLGLLKGGLNVHFNMNDEQSLPFISERTHPYVGQR